MGADGTLYHIQTGDRVQNNVVHPHVKYQRTYNESKLVYHISAKRIKEWTDDMIAMKSEKM